MAITDTMLGPRQQAGPASSAVRQRGGADTRERLFSDVPADEGAPPSFTGMATVDRSHRLDARRRNCQKA